MSRLFVRVVKSALCGGVLALASTAAFAEPDAMAFEAYVAGDYAATERFASAAGDADSLALAARAMNAAAYFEPDRKRARDFAKRAFSYAEAAADLNPDLPEARLQSAIALAVKGANTAAVKSFVTNLAGRARDRIDAALEIDPENPWALSTSAAWRLEVARRGGGALYDPDPELGYAEFVRARTLAPDNIAVAYECALRLLASERPEWREDALAALEDAVAATPANRFERDVQSRAIDLKEALGAGSQAFAEFVDDAA